MRQKHVNDQQPRLTGRWRERLSRLWHLGRAHRAHADLDAEFEAHRAMAVDDYLRQGYSQLEAERLAAARFGSTLAAREIVDDQRSIPHIENALDDLHHAWRSLRRTPGFTAAAIAVLGIGMAVNIAVFAVTNASLFKGFRGVPDQDRLVYVTAGQGCCLSYLDLTDWRTATKSFTGLEAVADLRVSIDTGRTIETATSTEVTAGLFTVLGIAPILGRDFVTADDAPGAPQVAILSHDFWRARFASHPSTIGEVVKVNGETVTIIGVMPANFVFPQRQELWKPMGPRVSTQPRNGRGLWFAVGRLRDEVTIEQARVEMRTVGAQLAATYPATNTGVTPRVQTFSEYFIGPNAPAIYGALLAGVAVLLLIACANLVNLLLARAAGRTRELGVRLALGAGTMRIARLQIFESLLLASGGAVLGAWLSPLLLRAYAAVALPPTQPWAAQLLDYSFDGRVAGYLIALTLAVGVLTGMLPAMRTSAMKVQSVLRDGGRGTVGHSRQRRTTNAIVAAQIALAVLLLSAASVMLRSFFNVHHRALGYDPTRVLVALSSPPAAAYPDADARFRFFDRILAGVRSVPGIDSVALVDNVAGQLYGTLGIEIEGQAPVDPLNLPQARQTSISGGYFATLGTAMLSGRDFDDRDTATSPGVVIVNHRFAQLHWRSDEVLGKRLRVVTPAGVGPWLTVVGLAPDLHQGDRARAGVDPTLYRPMRQRSGGGGWVLARASSVPPRSLIAAMRTQIQHADPAVPIWLGPYTLDEWNTGAYWKRGVNGGLFTVLAVMALLLACLGLLAVLLANVASRRQELSVRIAIGASAADIVRLVTRQGVGPALIGLAIGLLGSLWTNRLLSSQLVDVSPWDPATFMVVTATILTATLIGCVAPALRATRVDPLQAMRGD